MTIRPIGGGYEPRDMDSVIALERGRRVQSLAPGESISFIDRPPPVPMRQSQSVVGFAETVQSPTKTADATVTTTDASAGGSLTGLLNLSATSNGGATALLAANDSSAVGGGGTAATATGPHARPDQIAYCELLLADPLLKDVVAAYCPDTPTSLPANATTDALVAQFGFDLTCRLYQASTAITRVFGEYCSAMDQAALQGPDGGSRAWVLTPGTPGQGDNDGTADTWTFHPEIFTADYAKGDSLAARAFDSAHGDDGSFAKITRVLIGTNDAGDLYSVTSGGIDPDSAQFKREDINDGGTTVRWESARMGRNALVQIDLSDPLEMVDPKAVWFDPHLGFVTANENIVPEDSTMENIVIALVIGAATCGIGTLICEGVGVAVASMTGGAIMGATGAVIGGLFQNGTVHFEDVVRGAVVGAIMGVVSQKLDGIGVDAETGTVSDWGARLGAITSKATIQGVLAELTGGDFKDAFGQGFAMGLAAEVGRSINSHIDAALKAETITAEQAISYRTLGRVVTTAIRALADPDGDPALADFAQTFLGETINAEFKSASAGGTGNAANTEDGEVELDFGRLIDETSGTSEGGIAAADDSATTEHGATADSALTERDQEGIEQSDEILARRGDELAEANGLNPVRLPDGRLQYPDGRILTPGGEAITDASPDSGNASAYPSQYRHTNAVAGVAPQGDLIRAPDLPMLAAEFTPILADGRHGTGVPYRDEAGRVFYQTFDADGNAVRLLSTVAAGTSLPLSEVASAMAPVAGIVLNAERTMGPWPLRIAAGATLAGTAWLIAEGTDGIFTREALSPEELSEGQAPLINVPASPGPAGTPGRVADNRDTSIPGYQSPDSQSTSTTILPATPQNWQDLIVNASAPRWVLVNGVPYRTDLAEHLAGPDGLKNGKIFGTHNLENAISLLPGSNYWLAPTATPGILELKYEVADSSTGQPILYEKTVYDPAVISDATMLNLAERAGATAWNSHTSGTAPGQTVHAVQEGGINFLVYINQDSAGNSYIGNVHPVK